MRKIMMSGIMALAAALAGGAPSIEGPGAPARRRGKGKGRVERIMGLHRRILASSRPERSRHWHNPKDPVQAERIAAAQAKRERKAHKLKRDLFISKANNGAHWGSFEEACVTSERLDPFYVNRGVSA